MPIGGMVDRRVKRLWQVSKCASKATR